MADGTQVEIQPTEPTEPSRITSRLRNFFQKSRPPEVKPSDFSSQPFIKNPETKLTNDGSLPEKPGRTRNPDETDPNAFQAAQLAEKNAAIEGPIDKVRRLTTKPQKTDHWHPVQTEFDISVGGLMSGGIKPIEIRPAVKAGERKLTDVQAVAKIEDKVLIVNLQSVEVTYDDDVTLENSADRDELEETKIKHPAGTHLSIHLRLATNPQMFRTLAPEQIKEVNLPQLEALFADFTAKTSGITIDLTDSGITITAGDTDVSKDLQMYSDEIIVLLNNMTPFDRAAESKAQEAFTAKTAEEERAKELEARQAALTLIEQAGKQAEMQKAAEQRKAEAPSPKLSKPLSEDPSNAELINRIYQLSDPTVRQELLETLNSALTVPVRTALSDQIKQQAELEAKQKRGKEALTAQEEKIIRDALIERILTDRIRSTKALKTLSTKQLKELAN